MALNQKQKDYVIAHLREKEKALRVVEIAKVIAREYIKETEVPIFIEDVEVAALVMSIGQMHPDISYIYDKNYKWNEHVDAIEKNAMHGNYSVIMAEEQAITLTEEQKAAIIGVARREYPNDISILLKIASSCVATEYERVYRGDKKLPAINFDEVRGVLADNGISQKMIKLTEKSYGADRFG